MEIRQLRYFVAAADAGTISRAAARCGVTQPSLSQQILKLEAELGAQLLDRLGRGVALTDAGRALLPRARSILAQVQETESNLLADVDAGRDRLAIGAIPTIAPYLLPGLIAALRAEFPACDVIVREGLTQHLTEAIADNDLDLAVMSTPPEHNLIHAETLTREPLRIVVPAEHPLCNAPAIAMADLRDQPAVRLDEMHCLGAQITEFCTAQRLDGNVVCHMTQIDTLLEFVRMGLGVSIVPEMVAARDTDPARRYLAFKRNGPSREIVLVTRAGRRTSRLAQRFAELLRERLARPDARKPLTSGSPTPSGTPS
ncbi:MAG: LysR family transcriptional regulator [Phycisphaerales bacterium JB054]